MESVLEQQPHFHWAEVTAACVAGVGCQEAVSLVVRELVAAVNRISHLEKIVSGFQEYKAAREILASYRDHVRKWRDGLSAALGFSGWCVQCYTLSF